MDTKQRLEILRQIITDYDLVNHIESNRKHYEKKLNLKSWQVGHDIALIDTLVNDEGLYPTNYELAQQRARQRLSLAPDPRRGGGGMRMDENTITLIDVEPEDGDWHEVFVVQGDTILERVGGNHRLWPRTYVEAVIRHDVKAFKEYTVPGGESGWEAWEAALGDGEQWVAPPDEEE